MKSIVSTKLPASSIDIDCPNCGVCIEFNIDRNLTMETGVVATGKRKRNAKRSPKKV